MTNPIFNPQPNYSGVMIQIANPAVNVGSNGVGLSGGAVNSGYQGGYQSGYVQNPILNAGSCYSGYPACYYNSGFSPQQGILTPNGNPYAGQLTGSNGQPVNGAGSQQNLVPDNGQSVEQNGQSIPVGNNTGYPSAYPSGYYLNDYTHGNDNQKGLNNNEESKLNSVINARKGLTTNDENNSDNAVLKSENVGEKTNNAYDDNGNTLNIAESDNQPKGNMTADGFDGLISTDYDDNNNNRDHSMNSYKMYADSNEIKPSDMSTSKNIIGDLDERVAKMEEEKKNSKETKIVALTDEYIKSLENYLNNPNDELRLMASKEILTRLDEDKDRYNDAALNALLNKMMQDPNKLVRIAALSAFASQLASGNDYTVQLLRNIQANPDADKEDILQAADILLKMSAGVEVKNIPNPQIKQNQQI